MSTEEKYWIVVASRDHVQVGVEGGFAQANHGKHGPMKRMHRGDNLIYYSSKEEYGQSKPYQRFTAVGEVTDDEPYVGVMSGDFAPYRRNIRYYACREVPIHPLLEKLSFIRDTKKWSFVFRRGFFEIPRQDYQLITEKMLDETG